MWKLTATFGEQTFEKTYTQYVWAATSAIRLQNIGWTVKVEKIERR